MALSPAQIRLTAAFALFAGLAGASYWVARSPVPRRSREVPPPSLRQLRPGATFQTVDGVVVGLDGKPTHADVSLVSEIRLNSIRGGHPAGNRAAVTHTDDGRFTLGYVPAGHYVVVARGDEGGDAVDLWAAAEIDQTDQKTATTRLQLKRSGSLAGQITLGDAHGATLVDLSRADLELEPADADAKASLLEGLPRVDPGADGRFTLADVPPGQYRLRASLGTGWLLDRVTVGGADGLDRAFAIAPGPGPTSAAIAATDRPARLDGEAVGPNGAAGHFALVFVFPKDPADRVAARRTRAVRADAKGHFSLIGLPSGDYLVALAGHEDPATYYSAAFLETIAAGATTVELSAGTTRATIVGGRPRR